MSRVITKFVLLTYLLFSASLLTAQTFPNGFSASDIGSGWVDPMGTAFNSTGTKLFVWEKAGRIYVCNWNALTQTYDKQATPVLNIAPEVGNWRDHGMMSVALDPNFETNGLIYMSYVVDRHYLLNFGTGSYNANTNTYLSATIGRVTRYKTIMSGGNLIADVATRFILIGETKTTGVPILYESHGMGTVAFAADGTLLVTAGDAASYDATDYGSDPGSYYSQALTDGIIRANENVGSFRSQMVNTLSGKMLRIDPTTGDGISSNPFYNPALPRSPASRVWTLGLRNPFRMSVRPNTGSTNPATGDLGEIYISDVGWGDVEELNIIKYPAANCGWPFYEGLSPELNYAPLTTFNKDEVNPLFGSGGCTQQWFTFRNLLKQATADNIHTVYNPCNPAVAITSVNDNRFFHRLPAIDWKHGQDSARVATFPTNNYAIQQVGSGASGVTGTPFAGNAAVAGCWYTGTKFPAQYQNTFFVADYGGTWIRNLSIQFTDQVQTVRDFSPDFGAIVHMSQNPLDSTLFCTDIVNATIKRITYGGNQAPVVKMSSNKTYGAAPLSVIFTGSNSFDPEGQAITYSWNFGDGSPVSTSANPTHSFTTGNSQPKKFVVKLTVKDNLNATSVDSIIISANNTPPNVTITSPINNSTYQLGPDTAYTLQAVVSDAEHNASQLSYVWQTTLRHNNHQHVEPIDTDPITSSVISRIGCNGDIYYWFIKLKVTDAAGLFTIDSTKIFPQCGGPLPLKLISFSVAAQGRSNILKWLTSDELNLRNFDIERSYDGANFVKIGSVDANGQGSYEFNDQNFLDGYVYYRLRMNDNDAKFANSLIVRVYTGTKASNDITISPNPFSNEFLLGTSFKEKGNVTIRIIDTKGAVVKTITKQVSQGFNSFNIDQLDNISKGVYFLELIQGTESRKTKLIKQD